MSDYLTAITLPAWSPLFPYSMIRFEDCTRVVMLGRLKPGVDLTDFFVPLVSRDSRPQWLNYVR